MISTLPAARVTQREARGQAVGEVTTTHRDGTVGRSASSVPGRSGWSVADQTGGLAPRARIRTGLADWLIDLGATTSFLAAKHERAKVTGLEIAAETIHQDTEQRGRVLEEREEEAAETVASAPGTLGGETAGVMVRYRERGWHEVKRGIVGGQVDGEVQAVSYVGARENVGPLGERVLAEAARRGALEVIGWEGPIPGRGLARLRRVVIVGEGAHWIGVRAADSFGERIEIIDFSRAAEHVGPLAHALFGEGTARASRWADFALIALRDEGAPALLDLLAAIKPPSPAAEVLRRERAYFRTNQDRMAYPSFVRQGLPIGSGAVASAGTHLVQHRLKRAGASWSEDGAHAILTLRCRLAPNRSLVT